MLLPRISGMFTGGDVTLRDLRVGAEVNLEADVIGKYVHAYLVRPGSAQGLTFEKLSEAGFL